MRREEGYSGFPEAALYVGVMEIVSVCLMYVWVGNRLFLLLRSSPQLLFGGVEL